jgi:lysophospholipase L1-like esterase
MIDKTYFVWYNMHRAIFQLIKERGNIMKNNFTKILALIIAVLTVLSSMCFVVSADTELVNLYDNSKATTGRPNASSATGTNITAENYYVSNLIEVAAGDKIYFGPCMASQGYYLTSYNASGAVVTNQITKADVQVVGQFSENEIICCWTVPAGTASFKMATAETFAHSTLITKNQVYDAEGYFKYMESKSIDISHIKKTETDITKIENKFPVSDKTFAGRCHSKEGDVATDSYRTSDYIPVKEGDFIYIAAAAASQSYHMTLYDANKKATTNVNKNHMVWYEDLGRGYMIYSYRMRPGTAYVRVVAASGVYNDGIELVTINQPFSGEQYRKLFNITVSDKPQNPDSPLNGLKGLFMGDSISFGAGDTLSYKHTGRAWAGRIQDATGLVATNASVSGAKASFITGDDTAKWLFNQYKPNMGNKYDIVVMHGGVNDARHERAVGSISASEDEDTLKGKVNTYLGGLQYLFYTVKKTQPDAKLFFIANHRLDGHDKGKAKDMSAYFDGAKELCEKYGIVFIDLYNNKELNDKLETTTKKYLPDTLHLNSAGYDIITPYIISALEAEFKSTTPETTVEETTAAPTPETTVSVTNAPETEAPSAAEPKGCGSVIGAASVIVACAAAVALTKKKED